jgi:diphosphomevalonate decarboxylase
LDTYPPIFYMNDTSRNIIKLIHAYNAWSGEIRAAYTFDAGPNAVLYTLDQYAVELCALISLFFPPMGEDYINNQEFSGRVLAFELDPSLVHSIEKHIQKSQVGDVKRLYFTKSGPGPRIMGEDRAIIDSTTGLNTYSSTKA